MYRGFEDDVDHVAAGMADDLDWASLPSVDVASASVKRAGAALFDVVRHHGQVAPWRMPRHMDVLREVCDVLFGNPALHVKMATERYRAAPEQDVPRRSNRSFMRSDRPEEDALPLGEALGGHLLDLLQATRPLIDAALLPLDERRAELSRLLAVANPQEDVWRLASDAVAEAAVDVARARLDLAAASLGRTVLKARGGDGSIRPAQGQGIDPEVCVAFGREVLVQMSNSFDFARRHAVPRTPTDHLRQALAEAARSMQGPLGAPLDVERLLPGGPQAAGAIDLDLGIGGLASGGALQDGAGDGETSGAPETVRERTPRARRAEVIQSARRAHENDGPEPALLVVLDEVTGQLEELRRTTTHGAREPTERELVLSQVFGLEQRCGLLWGAALRSVDMRPGLAWEMLQSPDLARLGWDPQRGGSLEGLAFSAQNLRDLSPSDVVPTVARHADLVAAANEQTWERRAAVLRANWGATTLPETAPFTVAAWMNDKVGKQGRGRRLARVVTSLEETTERAGLSGVERVARLLDGVEREMIDSAVEVARSKVSSLLAATGAPELRRDDAVDEFIRLAAERWAGAEYVAPRLERVLALRDVMTKMVGRELAAAEVEPLHAGLADIEKLFDVRYGKGDDRLAFLPGAVEVVGRVANLQRRIERIERRVADEAHVPHGISEDLETARAVLAESAVALFGADAMGPGVSQVWGEGPTGLGGGGLASSALDQLRTPEDVVQQVDVVLASAEDLAERVQGLRQRPRSSSAGPSFAEEARQARDVLSEALSLAEETAVVQMDRLALVAEQVFCQPSVPLTPGTVAERREVGRLLVAAIDAADQRAQRRAEQPYAHRTAREVSELLAGADRPILRGPGGGRGRVGPLDAMDRVALQGAMSHALLARSAAASRDEHEPAPRAWLWFGPLKTPTTGPLSLRSVMAQLAPARAAEQRRSLDRQDGRGEEGPGGRGQSPKDDGPGGTGPGGRGPGDGDGDGSSGPGPRGRGPGGKDVPPGRGTGPGAAPVPSPATSGPSGGRATSTVPLQPSRAEDAVPSTAEEGAKARSGASSVPVRRGRGATHQEAPQRPPAPVVSQHPVVRVSARGVAVRAGRAPAAPSRLPAPPPCMPSASRASLGANGPRSGSRAAAPPSAARCAPMPSRVVSPTAPPVAAAGGRGPTSLPTSPARSGRAPVQPNGLAGRALPGRGLSRAD